MMSYSISTDKSKLNISAIHDYLSTRSYWAKGRSLEEVKTVVEHSLCFGMYSDQGRQMGFARVLTDRVAFAYLMDVFILEEYRNAGLGKVLVRHILDHPDLKPVRRIMLMTKDAHGLYGQFGFIPTESADKLMERLSVPMDF